MKAIFSMMAILGSALMLHAQEAQKKPVRVETEHEHKGASHTHTRVDTAGMEHHSRTTWHYHSGPKRPQVKIDDGKSPVDSVRK